MQNSLRCPAHSAPANRSGAALSVYQLCHSPWRPYVTCHLPICPTGTAALEQALNYAAGDLESMRLSEHTFVLKQLDFLPHSGPDLLEMPFAEPTGYGLGKHGWVTLLLMRDDHTPLEQLEAWIDESYRAVAPKHRIAELDVLRGNTAH